MVGSTGTIMSMRFVRSKLRKREESHHQTSPTQTTTHVVAAQNNNGCMTTPDPIGFRQSPSSVWVFPPLPPQPNLYNFNVSSQVSVIFIIWFILIKKIICENKFKLLKNSKSFSEKHSKLRTHSKTSKDLKCQRTHSFGNQKKDKFQPVSMGFLQKPCSAIIEIVGHSFNEKIFFCENRQSFYHKRAFPCNPTVISVQNPPNTCEKEGKINPKIIYVSKNY